MSESVLEKDPTPPPPPNLDPSENQGVEPSLLYYAAELITGAAGHCGVLDG